VVLVTLVWLLKTMLVVVVPVALPTLEYTNSLCRGGLPFIKKPQRRAKVTRFSAPVTSRCLTGAKRLGSFFLR
jgi:hypothetical protein